MDFTLSGPAGRLEAVLDLPTGTPRAAVVLAHPHPLYGGSLRSRVLHEATRGFTRTGAAVLRFNFRGVGASRGNAEDKDGQLDDFRAALDAMAGRTPGVPLWAAGYSFGAWVATTTGAGDPRVIALIAIAPPLSDYDFGALASSPKPKFIIAAERDELCPFKAMHRFYAQAAEPKELVMIDAADHLFDGKASEVGEAVEDLLGDFEK